MSVNHESAALMVGLDQIPNCYSTWLVPLTIQVWLLDIVCFAWTLSIICICEKFERFGDKASKACKLSASFSF